MGICPYSLAAGMALGLAACQTVEPVSTGIPVGDRHSLAGLPLSDASRRVLAQDLDALQAVPVKQTCSASDITFLSVSLTLFAIGVDEPLTEPWSSAERGRFDALMARWQSIGGDRRDIAPRCRAEVSKLGLPIV
ncbi:hypothetical protein [Cognatishimia sp. F0-27]|uniref:hypothetical protein n=1 Tax=Cognatishimia sp. F0-27 TaxID=2816855 RepID=UPI001D0C1639|nr:hypothetical protein [Cognatishimia sp. F0-27]MCC1494117.1 hypothetical protein [Cognatishimia sp. F0-27]